MAGLQRLEQLAESKHIDLFYGDECGVSLLPCIPYGWRFKDEQVSLSSTSGKGVNCFALLTRDNRCFFRTTQENIGAATVCDYLDQFSHDLTRPTVVVLDNAPVHKGMMKKRREGWEARALYIVFWPVYSPELNIAEILWRELKYEWLQRCDYESKSLLCYRVWQTLAAVGRQLSINFKPYQSAN